jgi:hypothetical protein
LIAARSPLARQTQERPPDHAVADAAIGFEQLHRARGAQSFERVDACPASRRLAPNSAATGTFTDTTNNNTVQTTTAALTVNVLNPPIDYTLSVSVSGNGIVTSSPSGINCGSICTMNYSSGTPVMLTAAPAGGASFNGWGGACSGNGIDAVSGPGNAIVDVMRVVAAGNGSAGIQSNQSSGGIASVTVGSSMLRTNAIGIQATGGASLLTYGNNQVTGNAANGTFSGGATPQ